MDVDPLQSLPAFLYAGYDLPRGNSQVQRTSDWRTQHRTGPTRMPSYASDQQARARSIKGRERPEGKFCKLGPKYWMRKAGELPHLLKIS